MIDDALWQSIIDSDYAVPDGYTVDQLTPPLLEFLASPDATKRDTYGYMILAYWLYRRQYSDDQMRGMIQSLLPNLKHHIGENGTDAVFRRSFSAVILASLVSQDNKQPYLEEDQIRQILEAALDYLRDEVDLRGHIEGKGWAHSCAHTADLLLVLAGNRHLLKDDLSRILDAIALKMTLQTGYHYIHGEDQRLARAVVSTLNRNLLERMYLTVWLDQLAAVVDLDDGSGIFDAGIHSAYWNAKNLLQAVYFELAGAESPPALSEALQSDILERLKRFPH